MKFIGPIIVQFLVIATIAQSQVSGNSAYSQLGGNAKAEQNERAKRNQAKEDFPPTANSIFLEANVLVNVKADEYVAVFGLAKESTTVAECNRVMNSTVNQLTTEFRQLGIGINDIYVDFVAQNKVYNFEVNGEIAKEKQTGFELKKNISIHYKDKVLLDKIILATARCEVFDLIKVDYIVKDTNVIQAILMKAATQVIQQKSVQYEQLLGIHLLQPGQVYADKMATFYPTDMYDSYTAFETEDVSAGYYRQKFITQGARKGRTFYFNALSPKTFDRVINPVVLEPVVQFTLFLKVKYQMGSGKPIKHSGSK